MNSKNGTTRNSDSDEPRRPRQAETSHLVPGSPLSEMVSTTNNTVLGLSPAVTIAGAYLSMGLASQLGFFSNASQYQNHSTVALAAVVGAVKRKPSAQSVSAGQLITKQDAGDATKRVETEIQDVEAAMRLAEATVGECES